MQRRIFTQLPVAALAAPADWKSKRKQAARRRRRIIFNNDGGDFYLGHNDGTAEAFLANRMTGLAGSHVDAIFYCTGGFNLYTHRSPDTEFWMIGEKGERTWLKEILASGTDPLQITIDFCRRNRLEVYWTMRMNDTHDAYRPTLLTKWKQERPHLLMGKKGDVFPYVTTRWSTLDYGQEEVREKAFRILRDVAERYDVDGLELDFFRHPAYFRPQLTGDPVTQRHCDLMTGFLARVREMADAAGRRKGKPIPISARVPDSVGYARAIGLDLSAWLQQDLVDILVGSCYFHLEPWENFVALGRKYETPVYACLSGSRLLDPTPGDELYVTEANFEAWRGEALVAWKAGVDGIYTFNRFKPTDPLFREMGDPAQLERLPRSYTPNPGRTGKWLKDGERFIKLV
ncbi:MAG: hypothetical protein ACKV22_23000 [Bryobacteraceae bacterium]